MPSSAISPRPWLGSNWPIVGQPVLLRIGRLVVINLIVVLALFFLTDFVLSSTGLLYDVIPDAFRIHDAHLHHNLAPNVSGRSIWGPTNTPTITNSLGYRDARIRTVALRSDKRQRVVLIGDSFTEGIGLPWEKTFVGRFAAHFPDIEVLNAGVSSYSESMYWKKIVRLLDAGYQVDHVIVYIDISDVQDEAIYAFGDNGDIIDSGFKVNKNDHVGSTHVEKWRPTHPPTFWQRAAQSFSNFMDRHFVLTKFVKNRLRQIVSPATLDTGDDAALHLVKSWWTMADLPQGFGALGVKGALAKGINDMDQLAAALRQRGVKLSVGVYPWPDQMAFDKVDSRQVTVWRDWCKRTGCELFIDHFPDFFATKAEPGWQDRLYFRGDVHFNEAGNALMADRLIKEMRGILWRPR